MSEEGPDQGRAWLIAFAACLINLILSGISRMIGILYVAIIDEYRVSRRTATLPFTVRNSVRMLSGPLVGVFGQRYSVRGITLCGGVIATLGAALCSVAPDLVWLTIFWGGIHGIGFAFANTLFQVVVNQYFVKYRATASGIALSGACVGSFVFPIMMEEILNLFGLSGTFLILGGIVMNVLPPALLLCEPPWLKKQAPKSKVEQDKQPDAKENTLDSHSDAKENTLHSHSDAKENTLHSHSDAKENTLHSHSDAKENTLDSHSDAKENTLDSHSDAKENTLHSHSDNNTNGYVENVQIISVRNLPLTDSIKSSKSDSYLSDNLNEKHESNGVGHLNSVSVQTPTVAMASNTEISTVTDLSNTDNEAKNGLWEDFSSLLRIYKNPLFLFISFGMSTYIVIFIPVLTVIVDYGKDKGFPESTGKYLINSLALGDLIGRMCFGWVTDRQFITIPRFVLFASLAQGIFVAMFPFATSLATFMGLLVGYGMMAGSVLILFPVLVFKYVDYKDHSVAMGSVGFISGIVSFGIPLLIGHFRDNVGSYDGMFYITGSVSVLSGAIWLMEPILMKYFKPNKPSEIR